MHQCVFIENIIEELGLDDNMVMKNNIPLEGNPSVNDKYGSPANEKFI